MPFIYYGMIFLLTLQTNNMKRISLFFLLALAISIFPGCSVVSTIFKAGMWWAFILVFIVVALVIWLVMKARK
ncbi:MAG: hypothetical protein WDO71_04980 [Bacteroidota bacterium]